MAIDASSIGPSVAPAVPRFEPALMRRKLTGTLFYGACLVAIGILLLALVALLIDVFVRGLPWLDPQFLTGVPSRRPETCRHPPGARRVAPDRRSSWGCSASRSASPRRST